MRRECVGMHWIAVNCRKDYQGRIVSLEYDFVELIVKMGADLLFLSREKDSI